MKYLDKRSLLGLLAAVPFVGVGSKEAQAATYVVPEGKSQASVTWYDEKGNVQYSTKLDVKPGHKFRITAK